MVVAAVPAFVAATGCGTAAIERSEPPPTSLATEPPTAEAPTTEAPTTTTTTPPPSPEEVEVRALIDRYWAIYLPLIVAPSTDTAELASLLSGEAQMLETGRIESMARKRERVEQAEPSVFDHHILSVTFDDRGIASVRECVIDDLRLVQDVELEGIDRVVLRDGDVVTKEYTTWAARSDDGRWRITMSETTEYLQGVRDCSVFSDAPDPP